MAHKSGQSARAIRTLLVYLYTGRLNVTCQHDSEQAQNIDHLFAVWMLADVLEVSDKGLGGALARHIVASLTSSNVCEAHELALEHKRDAVRAACVRFMDEHWQAVAGSTSCLQRLSFASLTVLIYREAWQLDELAQFEIINEWLQHHNTTRANEVSIAALISDIGTLFI